MGQGTSVMTAKANGTTQRRFTGLSTPEQMQFCHLGAGKVSVQPPHARAQGVLRWEEGEQKLSGPFSCILEEGPSFLSPHHSTCLRRCGFCSLS